MAETLNVNRTKRIDKQQFKRSAGKCRICGEPEYAVLDVHRITPGSEGGKYTQNNSVCLCSKHHRLVHDGQITIDRYYFSSAGYLLRIFENGVERFV